MLHKKGFSGLKCLGECHLAPRRSSKPILEILPLSLVDAFEERLLRFCLVFGSHGQVYLPNAQDIQKS